MDRHTLYSVKNWRVIQRVYWEMIDWSIPLHLQKISGKRLIQHTKIWCRVFSYVFQLEQRWAASCRNSTLIKSSLTDGTKLRALVHISIWMKPLVNVTSKYFRIVCMLLPVIIRELCSLLYKVYSTCRHRFRGRFLHVESLLQIELEAAWNFNRFIASSILD